MTDSSDRPSDPSSPASREPSDHIDPALGAGLLEEETGPSSALAHLYRGELHRMKLWRDRLDRTTDLAVVLLTAVLTWTFSDAGHPHYVVLLAGVGVGAFLVFEARRYRAYDVWRSRVRVLQQQVWALGLDGQGTTTDTDWREALSGDYRTPRLKISMEEALAHRLRRVYFHMFTIVGGAWTLRVTVFADRAWPVSAAVGGVPGTVVTAVVVVVYAAIAVVCCRPRTWHTHGELLEENLRETTDSE